MPVQPPKRSRSIKDRPGTVEALELAIREDRLDLRTRESQQLVAIRDAITENPQMVARGAVRDLLAMNIVVSAAVARQLAKPGVSMVDAEGGVHPLVARHLELQKATLQAARALVAMEGRGGNGQSGDAPEDSLDISSIIREMAEAEPKNS